MLCAWLKPEDFHTQGCSCRAMLRLVGPMASPARGVMQRVVHIDDVVIYNNILSEDRGHCQPARPGRVSRRKTVITTLILEV